MNVYNFDGTIYDGDSSVDFCKFLIKEDHLVFKWMSRIVKASVQYIFMKIDMKTLKEQFFSFLNMIDGATYVEQFWDEHKSCIFK